MAVAKRKRKPAKVNKDHQQVRIPVAYAVLWWDELNQEHRKEFPYTEQGLAKAMDLSKERVDLAMRPVGEFEQAPSPPSLTVVTESAVSAS